jgi:predicted aconitase with swiveling domain
MRHDVGALGIAPRALIFNRVNPIIAQGAALADGLGPRARPGDAAPVLGDFRIE